MTVVAVAIKPNDLEPLVPWGTEFACGDDAGLVVVQPQLGPVEDPLELDLAAPEPDPFVAELLKELEDVELPPGSDGEERHRPQVRAFRVQGPDLMQAILHLLGEVDGKLLVLSKQERLKGRGAEKTLLRQLVRHAPCATLLLRAAPESRLRRRRILVPTAGGPNADAALVWADRMARHSDSSITALYVEPPAGEDPDLVGHRLLEKAIQDANLPETDHIEREVVVAGSISEAIQKVAAKDFDLVLIGASRLGLVRQLLFGTLPQKQLEGPRATAVGVIRAPKRLVPRTIETVEHWLARRLPQLSREDRVELFEKLQARSRWDVDFLLLMALSTAIAALGLIQSSTAVVIGAMLVAPLMTPLLSAAMALVQGNLPLLRTASKAIALGFFTALTIGFLLGIVAPMPALTDELLARGAPTLLDLGVGFFSGLAAAYASARPGLSAALPGVAIAAALVPPIATVGVSLSHGAGGNAWGAALLFSTNVVAIVLGAAICLHVLGLRSGATSQRTPLWVRRVLLSLLFVLLLLSVPLTSLLVSSIQTKAGAPMALPLLHHAIEARLDEVPGAELQQIRTLTRDPLVFEVTVAAPTPPGADLADALVEVASDHLDKPVGIRLVQVLAVYGQPPKPATTEESGSPTATHD